MAGHGTVPMLPAPPCAIIFDFDGVILDSAALKVEAYVTIYAGEEPAKVKELVRHAHLHGGTTRRTKFAQYERELFGRPGDPESVERLSRRYSDLVYGAVLQCPFIEGAYPLLVAAKSKVDMHVVSGTPDDELRAIIRERGLANFFRSTAGAPATKVEAFAQILRDNRYDAGKVVAIGDSMTEFWAAEQLRIPFLGIAAAASATSFPPGTPTRPSLQTVDKLLAIV
jgi:phosphoglycolate phosphatase-like HAD superfamily hydrolase